MKGKMNMTRTKYKKIQSTKARLESVGVEITLKKEKVNGTFGKLIVCRAELYWRGETGMGFDMHSFNKALAKAQHALSRKFQPQERGPIVVGLPGLGIASIKRRAGW